MSKGLARYIKEFRVQWRAEHVRLWDMRRKAGDISLYCQHLLTEHGEGSDIGVRVKKIIEAAAVIFRYCNSRSNRYVTRQDSIIFQESYETMNRNNMEIAKILKIDIKEFLT